MVLELWLFVLVPMAFELQVFAAVLQAVFVVFAVVLVLVALAVTPLAFDFAEQELLFVLGLVLMLKLVVKQVF